jgi:hypothetical protein
MNVQKELTAAQIDGLKTTLGRVPTQTQKNSELKRINAILAAVAKEFKPTQEDIELISEDSIRKSTNQWVSTLPFGSYSVCTEDGRPKFFTSTYEGVTKTKGVFIEDQQGQLYKFHFANANMDGADPDLLMAAEVEVEGKMKRALFFQDLEMGIEVYKFGVNPLDVDRKMVFDIDEIENAQIEMQTKERKKS